MLKHETTSFTTVVSKFHFMTRVEFTFLLSDGHESCFQLWGITNNTAVNLVHVSLCICMKIYLGQWLSNFFDHDSY